MRRQREKDPVKFTFKIMLLRAEERAKKNGIPFDLSVSDLKVVDVCPMLGLKLDYGRKGKSGPADNSPSLDRIIPELGYVSGNVRIVSHRGNRLRSDATLTELERLVAFLRT